MKLRLEYFVQRAPFWGDEIAQITHTVGPFQPVWEQRSWGDITCFPGDYLVTYPFLRLFGLHTVSDPLTYTYSSLEKWQIIFPHFLSTVLGFYFLYRLCNWYFKTIWGFIIAFSIVGFNQQLIYHSMEYRPYAVLPTLALAMIYFTNIFTRNFHRLSAAKKNLFGIFCIFVILFHAYGILIFTLCSVFVLVMESRSPEARENRKDILMFLAGVGLAAFPLWALYATGNPLKALLDPNQYNTFAYIPNPLQDMTGFLKGVFGNLIGYKKIYFLLGGILLGAFLSYREKRQQIFFFLLLIVLPIQIILLLDLFKAYFFLPRQFVWVMPLFAFFLGWVWDSLIYSSNLYQKKGGA